MKMDSLGQFPTVQDYILVLLFQKKKMKKNSPSIFTATIENEVTS